MIRGKQWVMKLLPRTLSLLFFALLTIKVIPIEAQNSNQQTPKVYALVIGVGDYDDGHLDFATSAAKKFMVAVTNTYPSAIVCFLPDEKATTAAVQQCLEEKLAKAPPGSLLIFYFAGHGLKSLGQVFLLMHGGTQSSPWGNSIAIDEVLAAILQAHTSTAMIFLDCCFSGGTPPLIKPGENYNDLDSRVFMLTSSYSSQQTIGGIFTDALLQTWTNTDSPVCLTPRELAEDVTKVVYTNSNHFMTPILALGKSIDRCFARLDKPASLLIFRFPNGCSAPAYFYFNDQPDFDSFREEQGIYFRQIPKNQTLTVRIEINDSIVWKHTFSLADLKKSDDMVIDVPLSSPYANPAVVAAKLAYAQAKDSTARIVESYGATSNELANLYADAIETWHTYASDHDMSDDIAKLSQYGMDNPTYRLVTGTSGSSYQQDFNFAVALQEQTNVVTLFESANENELAAMVSEQAAKTVASSDLNKFQFNMYRAAADYKAAGFIDESTNLTHLLLKEILSPKQIKSVAAINEATPYIIRQSSADLIATPADWKKLNIGE